MVPEWESKLLAREMVIEIKGNERAFYDFIDLIERNNKRREVFLFVLKRILVDESAKIYSS